MATLQRLDRVSADFNEHIVADEHFVSRAAVCSARRLSSTFICRKLLIVDQSTQVRLRRITWQNLLIRKTKQHAAHVEDKMDHLKKD